MSIEVRCPHCQKRLAIKRLKAGHPLRCPICTGVVPVVEPAADAPPPTAGGVSPCWWVEHPDNPPSPDAGAPRWHELVNRRIIVAAGLGAVLLVTGLLAAAGWLTRPADPVLAEEAPAIELALIELPIEPLTEPVEPAGLPAGIEDALELPAAAKVVERPAAPEPVTVKRRQRLSDEDLRRQLLRAPEATLDPPHLEPSVVAVQRNDVPVKDRTSTLTRPSSQLLAMANRPGQQTHFTPVVLKQRGDLFGLPFRMGDECQMGKEPAENMQAISRKMRAIMAQSQNSNGGPGGDGRLNADYMRDKMGHDTRKEFVGSDSVPCLMQMLQPENRPVRKLLVEQLGKIKHRSASEGLARVALFDLADEIREQAINELNNRPREEYRHILLAGLRHVWTPAADHAAEALVALADKAAVPQLQQLAREADPTTATYDHSQKSYVVPELVRINHLSNCLMCHAPSRSTSDLVRGRIPSPNQPLPPLSQYYEDNSGIFVRADVTYLKQDFSVYQPVDRPGHWPSMQRFDYLVRTRKVETQSELAARQARPDASYPQREAVMFAITELTR
jgi:hypothetical protein